ncbi:hypothetical protein KHS38_00030 [Mucilaginibacter sp. Bleaf8]|uniref:polymer-forming cytoskeletal protein n=1 Tax=Mucilaginibacter sp. Bleaf8 TaxID=2834430 RepID=UPI001BD19B37|nr:polymer-forming cytoskeletal protein [Mucilaginibacter sp. Bleaf8]MBS7562778.1 hypothetical protein [Mucilaginibacter sp. Bleaf8]
MLKASALYMVIVIALVIAVICSSLITAAYFYKLQYQKTFRYTMLQNNLASAVNILLESDADYNEPKTISLFHQVNDSVQLMRKPWGLFNIGVARAFIQKDTLTKVFTMGNQIDSTQWAALYIIDEDRSLSVSGKTTIKGDAYLPKAGIQEAYVNNHAYQGDKRIVIGKKHNSDRRLPKLDEGQLQILKRYFIADSMLRRQPLPEGSLTQSFLLPAMTFVFGKEPQNITEQLSGHIVLQSDTSVTLDGSCRLNNVLVFAKSIMVKSGFTGTCQLFATDSITVEDKCSFGYPSVLGVLKFDDEDKGQEKLSIGDNVRIDGTVFTYEKAQNEVKPLIELGKNAQINGRVYAQGLLNYKDGASINGNVYAGRFLYQTAYTRYENYLINIRIDAPALSPYYLTNRLLPASQKTYKILQWLEAK